MDNPDGVTSDRAKEIGARIAQARNELGVTQKELADLVHVSSRAVTDWETGKTVPWARMEEIGQILEKPKAWLLWGQDQGVASEEVRRLMEQVLSGQRDIVDQIKLLRIDLAEQSGKHIPF